MAVGDVIFNAKLNTKPLEKDISKVERMNIKSPFRKFREDVQFISAGFRASAQQMKAAQKEALGYAKVYDDLAKKGQAFKESMEAMIGGPTLSQQEEWEKLSESIQQAEADMREAFGYLRKAERGYDFKGKLMKLRDLLTKIPQIFKNIGHSSKNAGNSISHGMGMGVKRMLGLVGAGSLVYKALQYVREGMANLINYDKGLANSISMVKGSLASLKNAMAAAVSPIIQALAPAISSLIDLFTRAANAVAMFFSALTGKKITVVASEVSGGIGGIGSAADGANKSAKELKRTLMGFDKINKLDSDDGSGGGGGGGGSGGGGGGGFTTVPVSEDALEWADKFRESWEKADFYWLGELLAEKINGALESINWDKINDTLQRLAKSIGTFLNGFIENLDWGLLAKTISNGIKAALDFAITLLNTINGEAVGRAIVDFLTGLDWVGIFKRAFVELPTAILNALVDIFKGVFLELGAKISDLMPDSLKNIFSGIGAQVLHPSVDWSGVGGKKIDVTARFVDWVKGTTFGNIIGGMVSSFVSWAKGSGFGSTVTNMVSSFKSWKKANSFSDTITGLIASFTKWKWGKKPKKAKVSGNGSVRASGGVFTNGKWRPIQSYASGGSPDGGQMFIARENGPELVGTLGGHTAVMNNDQIVASVSSGVAKAIAGIKFNVEAPRLAYMGGQTSARTGVADANSNEIAMLLRTLISVVQELDLDISLDGETIKDNVVRRINNHTRATGRLELVI